MCVCVCVCVCVCCGNGIFFIDKLVKANIVFLFIGNISYVVILSDVLLYRVRF